MNTLTLSTLNSPAQQGTGKPYLRVKLDPQTSAILPMEFAREVLDIPVQRLTPMPNMAACILGLMNWRSRALWVVDLAQLLELHPLESGSREYHITVIRAGDVPLALAVNEIEGVMRVATEAIQSPVGVVTAGLTPYLRGVFLQQSDLLLVLDAAAIVRSPILHNG
jgi:twitching motility protein PilI